jgi:hypothetical protein
LPPCLDWPAHFFQVCIRSLLEECIVECLSDVIGNMPAVDVFSPNVIAELRTICRIDFANAKSAEDGSNIFGKSLACWACPANDRNLRPARQGSPIRRGDI